MWNRGSVASKGEGWRCVSFGPIRNRNTYDVSNGKIQRARIYLLVNVLLAQIAGG